MLHCCNLSSMVDFHTRIPTNPGTAISCIFIDTFKMNNCTISSLINGLPDHNSQLVMIYINFQMQNCLIYTIMNINKCPVT
jgi:hypothetical protein